MTGTKTDWRAINSALHFHLNPARLIQLVQTQRFGIALLKVTEQSQVGPAPAEPALHNHAWNQYRIILPGILSESICRLSGDNGLHRRRVGLFSRVRADEFLGDRKVARDTWMVIVTGRASATAGRLSHYSASSGQAHFDPLFEPAEEVAPPRFVINDDGMDARPANLDA